MDDKDIARSVASELAIEYGEALRDKTDQIIRTKSDEPLGKARGIADVVKVSADLAVIASFIVSMTPVVREKWFATKSDAAVKASLEDIARRTPALSTAIVEQIAEAILKRFHGTV
ncbi:MAG TPA: hypothetical protein VK337_07830 [Xanthobacteraceae bacterium]|nr:hypothetical protein [Xanthobacteraceae bacterium]